MTISVSIEIGFDGFNLNAAFDSAGQVTAIYGPSGAGKSTILNAISGLVTPDAGRVQVAKRVLFDAAEKINSAPHHRRIGYVFQDPRLFPHMSVRRNIAYGASDEFDAADLCDILGITHLLDRRTSHLSGGEAQRVAIARALATEPDVLLMDEPLTALDVARRAEVIPYLKRLVQTTSVPLVVVSHDIADIAQLADVLVVMRQGKVRHAGPLMQVLSDPKAVADVGVQQAGSVLSAKVSSYSAADQLTQVSVAGQVLWFPGHLGAAGATVRLRVLAQDVILAKTAPKGISALNILTGEIADIATGRGPGVAVQLRIGDQKLLARITRKSFGEMGLNIGDPICAIVKATAMDARDLGL